MKNTYYLLMLVLGLSYACTADVDPLFEKPASERMKEALDNYRTLLQDGSGAWLVEYYPHSSRTYGGFNLFFQFKDELVTIKSDVESPLLKVDEDTNHYTLGEDMGPTLNCDSYNRILNYFSDPALSLGGGVGLGLEGDYEFLFMSGNAQEVILRGKKTKNTIRMTPMKAEDWQAYREGVMKMKNAFSSVDLSMTVDGKSVTIKKPSDQYNRFTFEYEEENDDMAYLVTPTGIRFYEPITINGITMQEFTFDNDKKQMTSVDGKAVIKVNK